MIFTLLTPCFFLSASSAYAQEETRIPLVESLGEATTTAIPAYAEFWLHQDSEGLPLEESLKAALEMDKKLRSLLSQARLHPTDIESGGPAILDLKSGHVRASARLQFTIGALQNPETGAKRFAALCEALADIAETLNAELTAPRPGARDKKALVKAAIKQATESAYEAAEAVAETLSSAIFAVDTVQVLEIEWDRTPETQFVEPSLTRVSCTARVRVVYSLTAPR